MSTQLPSLPSDTRLVTGQAHGENKTGIVQFTMCKKLEDLEFADDLVLLSERIATKVALNVFTEAKAAYGVMLLKQV